MGALRCCLQCYIGCFVSHALSFFSLRKSTLRVANCKEIVSLFLIFFLALHVSWVRLRESHTHVLENEVLEWKKMLRGLSSKHYWLWLVVDVLWGQAWSALILFIFSVVREPRVSSAKKSCGSFLLHGTFCLLKELRESKEELRVRSGVWKNWEQN